MRLFLQRRSQLVTSSRSPPEIVEPYLALPEWICANKDGNGDESGELPDEAVGAIEDYFVGSQERCREQRILHAAAIKFRCESSRSLASP